MYGLEVENVYHWKVMIVKMADHAINLDCLINSRSQSSYSITTAIFNREGNKQHEKPHKTSLDLSLIGKIKRMLSINADLSVLEIKTELKTRFSQSKIFLWQVEE